jgi:GNAT superfamily N-acetyltransferase
MAKLIIEPWEHTHPRWGELETVVINEQQSEWFSAQYEWHRSSHVLVALEDDFICGFLRFTVQVIGVDADCEPVMLNGIPLLEGKVLAFAVIESYRRQGIGRALQTYALHYAAKLHCYQLRSHSSGKNVANHYLKLSMGFGIHPIIRDNDNKGAYFVMPLYRFWDEQQKDEKGAKFLTSSTQ